jgi:hypothetical protein
MVHTGRRYVKELNEIPGSETPLAHVKTIFDKVLEVNKSANIDIIAIGQSCEVIMQLFEDERNWTQWGHRLGGMLLMGTVFPTEGLTNVEFKDFLAKVRLTFITFVVPLLISRRSGLALISSPTSLSTLPWQCLEGTRRS